MGAEAYIYYIGEPDAAIRMLLRDIIFNRVWKLSIEKTILSYCQKHCLKHHIDIKYARIYLWWLSVDNFIMVVCLIYH